MAHTQFQSDPGAPAIDPSLQGLLDWVLAKLNRGDAPLAPDLERSIAVGVVNVLAADRS